MDAPVEDQLRRRGAHLRGGLQVGPEGQEDGIVQVHAVAPHPPGHHVGAGVQLPPGDLRHVQVLRQGIAGQVLLRGPREAVVVHAADPVEVARPVDAQVGVGGLPRPVVQHPVDDDEVLRVVLQEEVPGGAQVDGVPPLSQDVDAPLDALETLGQPDAGLHLLHVPADAVPVQDGPAQLRHGLQKVLSPRGGPIRRGGFLEDPGPPDPQVRHAEEAGHPGGAGGHPEDLHVGICQVGLSRRLVLEPRRPVDEAEFVRVGGEAHADQGLGDGVREEGRIPRLGRRLPHRPVEVPVRRGDQGEVVAEGASPARGEGEDVHLVPQAGEDPPPGPLVPEGPQGQVAPIAEVVRLRRGVPQDHHPLPLLQAVGPGEGVGEALGRPHGEQGAQVGLPRVVPVAAGQELPRAQVDEVELGHGPPAHLVPRRLQGLHQGTGLPRQGGIAGTGGHGQGTGTLVPDHRSPEGAGEQARGPHDPALLEGRGHVQGHQPSLQGSHGAARLKGDEDRTLIGGETAGAEGGLPPAGDPQGLQHRLQGNHHLAARLGRGNGQLHLRPVHHHPDGTRGGPGHAGQNQKQQERRGKTLPHRRHEAGSPPRRGTGFSSPWVSFPPVYASIKPGVPPLRRGLMVP